MKKAIIIICILLVIALLVPIPIRLKDGGTVKYQAILYTISDVHRLAPSEPSGYEDGVVIEILGMAVYNNIGSRNKTVQFHGQTINKSELSTETIEWLEWYNQLSETDQMAISYIPSDLYELGGYLDAEDAPAVSD